MQIAIATFLCILAPITLFILGAATEIPGFGVSETVMGVIGLIVLFAFVLTAVPIYIYCGFKNEPYAFLDKNVPFELEYGVKGIVTEHKRKFRDMYVRWNIIRLRRRFARSTPCKRACRTPSGECEPAVVVEQQP